MGYHLVDIEKGELGEFSKIREEFLEAEDAFNQGNIVMVLLELSDMLGAIDLYCRKYNIDLVDLVRMTVATRRAFEDGTRS